jgi:hypothetical protein
MPYIYAHGYVCQNRRSFAERPARGELSLARLERINRPMFREVPVEDDLSFFSYLQFLI